MKKKISRAGFASVIITMTALYSCSTGNYPPDPYYVDPQRQELNRYYRPVSANTPLLSDSREFSGMAGYSFSEKYKGVELNGAYKITRHIGLMAAYRTVSYKHGFDKLSTLWGIEAGAGYSTLLHPNIHFETYAGYGSNKIDNDHHTGNSRLRISSFFLQPAFAFQTDDRFVKLGIMTRLSRSHFFSEQKDFNNDRERIVAAQYGIVEGKTFTFIEPGLVLRLGPEYIKFQGGVHFLANNPTGALKKDKTTFSVGIMLHVEGIRK